MTVTMAHPGYLLLETGEVFVGQSFGANKPHHTALGELVFNTGMTGYQEILTDPSYAGQVVVLTYPLIGNYGISPTAVESKRVQAAGLIVKEASLSPSHWQNELTLDQYLRDNQILGISGLDTRQLTLAIRKQGVLRCLMSTEPITDAHRQQLAQWRFPTDVVANVSCTESYQLDDYASHRLGRKIGVLDFGVKTDILKCLNRMGADVTVYPWNTPPEVLLEAGQDAILLSNGPGDPKDVTVGIDTARALLGQIPIFGICLGVQILALAMGADTYKLKFGHRGSNHPVQDVQSGQVFLTAQNHGYAIAQNSLPKTAQVTHINLNDNTIAGFRIPELRVSAVQFHPEAGPGPRDAHVIFEQWMASLKPNSGTPREMAHA